MKSSVKKTVLFTLFLLLGFSLHRKEMNSFPQYIHAWAQSDYYALSRGFIDNGMDFFHPKTFTINPQFSDSFQTADKNGITSADFPVNPYIVATLMKVFNTESPWVYRSYTLIYSIIGLYFLFLLIKALDGNDIKAFFTVLLVWFSPVYLYYQDGFLPTIPAISNTIIAYYFYVKYIKEQKSNYFKYSLFFVTLATLIRTPFAIYLIAISGQEILKMFVAKKWKVKQLVAIAFAFAVPIGYFLYNSYLRSIYGSIFLGKPLTPENLEIAKEILLKSLDNWKYHYLTKWHYLSVFIGFLLGLTQYLRTKKIDSVHKELFLQIGIVAIGVSSYSYLMLKQFREHDYYFLDTFFILFIIFTVTVLSYIEIKRFMLSLIGLCYIFFASYGTIEHSLDAQRQRKETVWRQQEMTISNYTGASQLLDELNISKDAVILSLDADAPNIRFLLLNRTGYTVHRFNKEHINEALKSDFDYIVLQNTTLPRLLKETPQLKYKLKRIGGNKGLSVFQIENQPTAQTIKELLGLEKPLYSIDYKSVIPIEKTIQNKYCFKKNEEYGSPIKIDNFPYNGNLIYIETEINKPTTLVVFIEDLTAKKNYYQALEITPEQKEYWLSAPKINQHKNKASIYIWNNTQDLICIKKLKINIY